MCICICICMYVYMYVCVCIYIYIYIYTCIRHDVRKADVVQSHAAEHAPTSWDSTRFFMRSAQVRAWDHRAECRNVAFHYRQNLCPVVLCPYLCSSDVTRRASKAARTLSQRHFFVVHVCVVCYLVSLFVMFTLLLVFLLCFNTKPAASAKSGMFSTTSSRHHGVLRDINIHIYIYIYIYM